MDTKDILNELNQIFRKVLKRDNIELENETTARDIEGWDSLTNMILVNEVETKFGVRFTFRDIMRLKNVGDMCNAIQVKMK
ncbi:MAG: acyl carrier protein [Niabella sp.]